MRAYEAALAQQPAPSTIGATRTKPGTVNAAVAAYIEVALPRIASAEFRRVRRNILERFRIEHGEKPIALLNRAAVERMITAKVKTPVAAANFLKALRALIQFCIATNMCKTDSTLGVKAPKVNSAGFATWTEEQIAAFEARHPVGTRARLALSLLLYTAQRRSDVIRMGRQHIRNGAIRVRQQKTGTELSIPLDHRLKTILDQTPSDHLTFLVTKEGKPFTPAGFGNWFREVCDEAGLPRGLAAHGLRKAACRRLAELGLSEKVIASISGHTDLREIARYTRDAEQERLARIGIDAMAKVGTLGVKPSA